MNILSVKNLKKSFGGTPVLKGVDLTVEKGETVAVLGSSGGGKTTFLRCLNFLENADEGEMTFNGNTYSLKNISEKEKAAIRLKTGFVFQNFNLFLNKTVLENVTEGLTVARKIHKDEATQTARKMLELVNMSEKEKAYPAQLSGGQQQRVAIARALATDPEIIYFDEPTSALDPELTTEVLETIKKLAGQGVTMVIVTHELSFARNIADKIIFMEDGKILEEGSPKEIFENTKSERLKIFLRKEVKE